MMSHFGLSWLKRKTYFHKTIKVQVYRGLVAKINFALEAKELDEKTVNTEKKKNLEAHSNGFHFYKQEINNMDIYSFQVYSETSFKRKNLHN